MKKRFICKYERFYGELEDILEHNIYANDLREAFLIVIAMLSDFRAETQEEAIVKTEQFLSEAINERWTIDNFFDNNILIETSNTTYRLHYLYEDENINASK